MRNDIQLLELLLKDQSLSLPNENTYISWATDDYCVTDEMGDNSPFAFNTQITPELISSHPDLIQPRIKKQPSMQTSRSKSRAEVFTPAWICNAQNNLVDEQWFGRKDVFNTEYINEEGEHRWLTSKPPIVFPAKRSWMSYVRARRMEITCGEGPYLISRYDATTGRLIPISERIGMLDRKFRIINENTPSEPTKANKRQWIRKAYQALQSVYGFDSQGDNVFLTRESLFLSFCEYYTERWHRHPHRDAVLKAAEIISWNIWQMDGLNFNVPNSDHYAIIMEWHNTEPLSGKKMTYKDIMK